MTKEQILNLIYDRPVEIGHWLGYKDMTDLHNDWLRSFLFPDEKQIDQVLQAHRGSYKTTALSLFFALHTLINPNETIMYMRKTDQNVADICKQTQNILLSGALQKMAQVIYGHDLKLIKASSSEISTSLQHGVGGQSQISGFGINASITGRHADLIVTDDIITVKDRVSRAEREHTKQIVQELQNIKNRGGRFIHCGTPWAKDDAFCLMEDKKEKDKAKWRYKWTKCDCYETGLITPEKLREIRKEMTPSLFAANYELRHISDENALFRDPVWLPEEQTEMIYNGRAHIDAAYGGEDYTAYTIMKKTEDGYIGYGKLFHKHVDECLDEIEMLHEKYKAGSISCETNGDKGYLAKELQNRGMQVNKYSEHQNKYLKIASNLYKAFPNIGWIADTDPDYINQILDYTEDAAHDDAPDSAASLIRILEKGTNTINTGRYLMGGF